VIGPPVAVRSSAIAPPEKFRVITVADRRTVVEVGR